MLHDKLSALIKSMHLPALVFFICQSTANTKFTITVYIVYQLETVM